MGVLQVTLRTSIAAIIVAGALTARAQVVHTADVQLTGVLAPVPAVPATTPPTTVPPTKIDFGGTLDYTFTLVNAGPGHATGVQLAVTPPAGTTVTAVSGAACPADAAGNPTFPCLVSADLVAADPAITDKSTDPGAVIITVTITLDVPKTTPAACPVGTPLGNLTATVSLDPTAAAGPTTDPNLANNAATVAGATVLEQPFANLAIALDGPTSGTVGQSLTYTGTVTNNGPCPAENVVVTFVPGNLLTFQSGTGACPTTVDCNLNTIPVGSSIPFTTTYKVASLPSDVIQTTIPNELDVATDTVNGDAGGGVATTGIRVGKEAGGCNSGGPGGLIAVALMAAAVFAVRRRRTA